MANLTNSARLIEEMQKKANSASLSKVATSGSYSDLSNKPTIPTVNNSTISIQKNGNAVDSFTTNAASAKTINITLAKADVGLGNVDNTSDANKPVSNAVKTELDKKANALDVYTKGEIDAAISSAISTVYKYKGSKATYSQLPSTGNVTGDVWNVSDTNMNYAWDGSSWDPLGATIDLSNYFNKASDTSDNITQGTTKLFVSSTEKSTWNGKQNALAAQTAYSAKGSATKVPQITTNSLGQVTGITEVSIAQPDISGKQDTLTAGNLIDLTGNTVKNKALFVIKESDVTVSTDATKGVSPYNTSYGYTNIDINASAGVEWVEGALYTFIVNTKMVVATANRNVRVRIGTGAYLPVMDTSAILPGSSYFTKANIRYFQYTTKYQSGGALHLVTDSNTTYSAMTEAEVTAGTGTTARTITPAMLKTAVKTYGNDTDTSKGLQSFMLQSNSDATAATKTFQTTAGVDTDYMNSLTSYILTIQFTKGNSASSFTFTIGSSTVTAMGMPVGSNLPAVDSYGSITFTVANSGSAWVAIPIYWTASEPVAQPEIIYVTQAEYDALPSSKTSDGNHYVIYE